VVDHQLSAAIKQVGHRALAAGPFELVLLVDQLPWQVAPRLAQAVALLREGLLSREVLLTGRHPFFVRNDIVLHQIPPIRNYWLRMLSRTRNRRLR
jgi:hypothetical protein